VKTLFRLEPNEVHVWALRLDLDGDAVGTLAEVLSAAERSRARRFVAKGDRLRYEAAHGLLRVVLAGYLGVRPEDVAFEIGNKGKPRLADRRDPRFNLSHSGMHGLIAVSAGRELGIDIEEVRELGDLESLARTSFSATEQTALVAVPARYRQRAFFAGWTRKEAFLKALGEGLSRPLDSFDVTLAPGETARLLRVQGMPDASARYEIRSLRPASAYVAALAIERPNATLRYRSWRLLSTLLGEFFAQDAKLMTAGSEEFAPPQARWSAQPRPDADARTSGGRWDCRWRT
jgi:4'-phosphopantetheinyl transferase